MTNNSTATEADPPAPMNTDPTGGRMVGRKLLTNRQHVRHLAQLNQQLAQTAMDDIDRRLIATLRANARLSISSLAATLGVSRGTAQARLDRLLADGTIQGFTIRQPPQAEAGRVRAITLIEVGGGRSAPVIRALRALPEVTAVHTTNGRWDLVVDLAAENLPGFDNVLRRLRLIDGITNSETSLLLAGHGS